MSHDATNWAIQRRGLKPTTKIVLWQGSDSDAEGSEGPFAASCVRVGEVQGAACANLRPQGTHPVATGKTLGHAQIRTERLQAP